MSLTFSGTSSGTPAATINPATLTLYNDDALPVLLARTIDGTVLTLTYDKEMSSNASTKHFTVSVGGRVTDVSSISLSGEDAKKVNLTLARSAKAGESVSITYDKESRTDNGTPMPLTDAGGNEASSFAHADGNE